MRRFLPLVTGLALALVATTALAADGPDRRDARRADLLASHRQVNPEMGIRTDDRAQVRLGLERSALVETGMPVVSLPALPDQPVRAFGADGRLTVSQVSITEVEGVERRAPRGAWVKDGISILDDAEVQRMLETRVQRLPALVAHGLSDTGDERTFQLRSR